MKASHCFKVIHQRDAFILMRIYDTSGSGLAQRLPSLLQVGAGIKPHLFDQDRRSARY
jgi:hypothetical protein